MADIFVIAVFRDGKRIAQVDFEPDTATQLREIPFDEVAKRFLEPAFVHLLESLKQEDG